MPLLMDKLAAVFAKRHNSDGALALPWSSARRLPAAIGEEPGEFAPVESYPQPDTSLARATREEIFGVRPALLQRCANPHCEAGWLRLWRSRSNPVFEGGWCCSADCTQALVETALSRELDARGAVAEVHRHRLPLGLTMLEQGWITADDLRRALDAQHAAGSGRLGQWLVRANAATPEMVTRALALQWQCPVLPLDFHDAEALTPLLPRLFADAFGALPLRVAAGKLLYMGFESRLDPALALAVERMTGLRVESGLVEESSFREAHARFLKAQFPAVELIEAASERALACALAQAVERFHPVDSRLVRVHDCFWLRLWFKPQRGAQPGIDTVRDVIGSAAAGH